MNREKEALWSDHAYPLTVTLRKDDILQTLTDHTTEPRYKGLEARVRIALRRLNFGDEKHIEHVRVTRRAMPTRTATYLVNGRLYDFEAAVAAVVQIAEGGNHG